jgi:hypothetical protein
MIMLSIGESLPQPPTDIESFEYSLSQGFDGEMIVFAIPFPFALCVWLALKYCNTGITKHVGVPSTHKGI